MSVVGSLFGSLKRNSSSLADRVGTAATDVSYTNVLPANGVNLNLGNPVAVRNLAATGNTTTLGNYMNVESTGAAISLDAAANPVMAGMSVPANSSAASYYNIPQLIPRKSHGVGQSEQSAGSSPALDSVPPSALSNPPVPRRHKTSHNCPPANAARSVKDCRTPPTPVKMFPAAPHTMTRSKSLNSVRYSSPSRKEKSTTGGNMSGGGDNSAGGGRLRRRYSVGDIMLKLQAFVSGRLSLPLERVRSMTRFTVSHSVDHHTNPTKASPDTPTFDDGFVAPRLKRRSASEILHRSSDTEESVQMRTSPSPEKEVPPVPPPRLVVRPKLPAKTKVNLICNSDLTSPCYWDIITILY